MKQTRARREGEKGEKKKESLFFIITITMIWSVTVNTRVNFSHCHTFMLLKIKRSGKHLAGCATRGEKAAFLLTVHHKTAWRTQHKVRTAIIHTTLNIICQATAVLSSAHWSTSDHYDAATHTLVCIMIIVRMRCKSWLENYMWGRLTDAERYKNSQENEKKRHSG